MQWKLPPPVRMVGENEQVMPALGGGVQPKLTVPAKPLTMPRVAVVWPELPAVRVRDAGLKVTL